MAFLAALSIFGITATQVYWVIRAFDLQEAEFDRKANAALFNVAQKIFEISNTPSPSNNPVKQLSTNYYVVRVNSEINPELLEFLLRNEFEKRNLIADFEYGIYDCTNERMVYGDYIMLQKNPKAAKERTNFPAWENQDYYFGVRFPYRESQIINQLGIWIFSSCVLLVVIVFFVYTLTVILKQKRLSEIQKDFINNMTHEFKTPITTISLSTQTLQNQDILQRPERITNYITIIQQECNRLKQHVERVLQIARLEKETIELKKERLNLHDLVQEVILDFSTLVTERKGRIEYRPTAENAEINTDKYHLTNAILNLLDNALKYSPHDPVVQIKTHSTGKGIYLDITDNGIGIGSKHIRKIFEKFYRVPTGNIHDVKGFGLGLSYVMLIVKAHKGTVSVKSIAGQGSTFTVFLPFTT